ncbi:MAG: hypothetical protein IJ201_12665, partial [Solobacterium sp.]|nr:hypothetical protein [Solobacterium sp.]
MKKFWKRSAASLMAFSLLMGNNYAIHALDGEDPQTGENPPAAEDPQVTENTQAPENPQTPENTQPAETPSEGEGEPSYTIKGLLVSGETSVGDPVTINPADYTEQKAAGEVAPAVEGYSFGNAYITHEGNSEVVVSFGPASYITDGNTEVSYADVSNEEHVVEAVFSYTANEETVAPAAEEEKTEPAVEPAAEGEKTDAVVEEEAATPEEKKEETAEAEEKEETTDAAISNSKTAQVNNKKNAPVLLGAGEPAEYTVEIVFPDGGTGTIANEYSVYAAVRAVDTDIKKEAIYFDKKDNITISESTPTTVTFSKFYRQNGHPNEVPYSAGDAVEVVLGKNLDIEQNGESRGTIKGGDIASSGSVINGYEVSVTSTENKTTYSLSKLAPYSYKIEESAGNAIAFDKAYQSNWYLLSTLNKGNGGTYYYVTPIALDGSKAIPESGTSPIDRFYTHDQLGQIQIGNETAAWGVKTGYYQQGDTVTNELVHVSSSAGNYEHIVKGNDNNKREAAGNGGVANNYTVTSVDENGVGTITLTKISDFKIKTKFNDESGSPIDPATGLPTDYKLLVKMVRDGKSYYALHTVDGTKNPSDESGPVVFKELINNYGNLTIGNVPYYYSGTETISTQVVTGTDDLLEAITGKSNDQSKKIVRYNENTVGTEQNSDLTKDLFSTASTIANGVMETVFTKQENEGQDHNITVSFYKKHTPEGVAPELNENAANMETASNAYFFRVRLYNNGKLVAYKIVPVSAQDVASANTSGTFTHKIPGDGDEGKFKLVDDNGVDIDGGTLFYDPDVYTCDVRLYKANTAGQLPANLQEVNSKGTDTLTGFDFWKNVFNREENRTDISLYSAYKKKYQVIIETNPTAVTPSSGDGIQLNLIAAHQSSNPDKFENVDISNTSTKGRSINDDGNIVYLIEDQTTAPITYNWTSHETATNTITGNETFTLNLKQNDTEVKEGYPVKIGNKYYTVSYDTGRVEGTNVVYNDTDKVTTITHFVRLTEANYDPAIDPYDVLGEGAEYGVVANEYERKDHTETNFAVNKYIESTNAGIDLAANGGESEAMPFYVGEYNKIKFTGNTKVDPDIYTPSDSAEPYVHKKDNSEETTDHIHQDGTGYDVTVYPTSKADVKTYVDGLIAKLTDSSQKYRNKPSVKVEYDNNNRVIDTTSFPDDITIYIDATGYDFSNPGWHIKKLEGQSIVFNIPGDHVTISKEVVSVYKKNADGSLTELVKELNSNTDGNGGEKEHNSNVENYILNHIVFNAYEAKKVDFKNGPAGLFLAPDADFEEINGSGTGWVATGKKFTQTSAEWHFFRTQRKYKAEGDFTLRGAKKLRNSDGTEAELGSKVFEFSLYEVENPWTKKGDAIETVLSDSKGNVDFKTIKYTETDVPKGTTKNFYYLIEETVPAAGSPLYYDDVAYTAAPVKIKVVAVHQDPAEHGSDSQKGEIQISVYVVNGETETPITPTIVEEKPIFAIGDFVNKVNDKDCSAELEVTKAFTGRAWGDSDKFSFTLTAKNGAPMPTGTGNKVEIGKPESGTSNTGKFGSITYTAEGIYEYEIKEDIPAETDKIPGVTYDARTYTAIVTVSKAEGTGELSASVTYKLNGEQVEIATFTNTYNKSGEGEVKVKKTLEGRDWATNDSFEFTITPVEGAPAFNPN